MTLELGADIDPKYLSDNLLLTEDWDLQKVDADLAQFLDIESALSHDDLIRQLPGDLEIPMLDDSSLYGLGSMPLDEGSHLSDSSDSGLSECFPVKEEPLSPAASHYSENSEDSLNSQMPMDCATSLSDIDSWGQLGSGDHFLFDQTLHQQTTVFKYESPDTPPQTPPRDLSIISPGNGVVANGNLAMPSSTTCITMPTTSAVKKHSGNSITMPNSTNTIKLVIPAQGSNAAVNLTHVINGAPGAKTGTPLTQVLNTKVKIQPKPTAGHAVAASKTPSGSLTQGSPVTTSTTTTLPQGKPLVLTPAEFAKLTAQGVLKFNAPASGKKPTVTVKSPTTVTMGSPSGGTYSPGSLTGHPKETEVTAKLMKRQQRMIKNRESACLSRKRKKEYMSKLEDRLNIFNMENEKLRIENQTLKRRVELLQNENVKLRKSQPGFGPMKKGATLLLGVMLLLSLNLGPLTSLLPNGGLTSGRLPAAAFHSGRTLLSFNENTEEAPGRLQFNIPDSAEKTLTKPQLSSQFRPKSRSSSGSEKSSHLAQELMLMKQMEALDIHQMATMCPSHFNTTESMRVLQELRGWVMGHEQTQQREQENRQFQPPKEKARKKYYPPRKLKAAMSGGLRQYSKDNNRPIGQYEVQVVSGERHYNRLMDQLQRRNDTFYVVSFRRDHFLLPATAHNKTTRPRMSLVMPAMGLNESMPVPDGSIAMMQIDCEVTHTKLVHIQESAVPSHLKENTTNHPDTDGRGKYRNDPTYRWP